MCASYGLDPRYNDEEYRAALEANMLEGLRAWSRENAGEVLLPTGKNRRNLNPIIRGSDRWELGWWGYLVNGAPAGFASINTRSERLASARGALPERAIVPASYWREMQKPSRIWQHFALPGDEMLGLAAVTRPGRTADGLEVTCFSIVMEDARDRVREIHDRMPLLIPAGFAEEWLSSDAPAGELISAAAGASAGVASRIEVQPQRPQQQNHTLF
ncbi:putative SOS response-associated peptidase YedK [Microbacterium keratanolyticum]|uniref:Abasic site processing protein n=1 Tax=Microbacterium keratanolyticum TaxID=67574 RepID=A0A9W6HTI7_9MICO|nr:SOS response-associated peptidase family protein [Microbacterium keratanolyticum]MBM7469662.1 putative SOS response-associated peptidase YedK [Microbacterium keratanolyticum]GLK01740.1 hypothetical protein GCM10017596_14550 [Microbacterium keratanolyticum]